VQNVTVELRGVDKMQRDLQTMARRSVPFAARETLNTLAFEGRKIWQAELQESLTLRNQFTTRRVLVDRCRTLKMTAMEATLGHTERYVADLEAGKSERAKRSARAIPTEHAAGQGKGSWAGGRKRDVRKPNLVGALGNIKRQPGSSRKARNARSVRQAIKNGKRLVYLDMGRRKGIYRVMGGKRKPTIRKVYDLSRRVTPRPKVPTLQRTLAKALVLAPSIAHAALLRQLRRNNVAGY